MRRTIPGTIFRSSDRTAIVMMTSSAVVASIPLRMAFRTPGPRARFLVRSIPLNAAQLDLGVDPGNDLIEGLGQCRPGFKSQPIPGLFDPRYTSLDIVLVGFVGDGSERFVTIDLPPDDLGQLADRGRSGRREVEILVEGQR